MNECCVVDLPQVLMIRGEDPRECFSCGVCPQFFQKGSSFACLTFSEVIPKLNASSPRLILLRETREAPWILEKVKRWMPWVPVLVFSDQPTVERAVFFMKLGASDYLSLPLSQVQKGAFIQSLMSLKDSQDDPRFRDEVTGLWNQRYLKIYLQEMIEESARQGKSFGVLFLDLDRFKSINDSYGHHRGTELLCELSEQMRGSLRVSDRIFRYGGDEFVVILASLEQSAVSRIAARLKADLENRVYLQTQGFRVQVKVSLGISLFPDQGVTAAELIEAADQAMYREKRGVGMSNESLAQIKRIHHGTGKAAPTAI